MLLNQMLPNKLHAVHRPLGIFMWQRVLATHEVMTCMPDERMIGQRQQKRQQKISKPG